MDELVLLLLWHHPDFCRNLICQWLVPCPRIDLNQKHWLLGILHPLFQLSHDEAVVFVLTQSKLFAYLQAIAQFEIHQGLLTQGIEVIVPTHVILGEPELLHEETRVVHVVNRIASVHDSLPATLQSETHGPERLEQGVAGHADERDQLPALPLTILVDVIVWGWEIEVQRLLTIPTLCKIESHAVVWNSHKSAI